MFVHKNAEGYPDPTVGEAMSNIAQEERRKEADRLAAISALPLWEIRKHDRIPSYGDQQKGLDSQS